MVLKSKIARKRFLVFFIIILTLFLYQKFFMWSWSYSTCSLYNQKNERKYYIIQRHNDLMEDYVAIISEKPIWYLFFLYYDKKSSVVLTSRWSFNYLFDNSGKLVIYGDDAYKSYIGINVKTIVFKNYKDFEGDIDTLKIIKYD